MFCFLITYIYSLFFSLEPTYSDGGSCVGDTDVVSQCLLGEVEEEVDESETSSEDEEEEEDEEVEDIIGGGKTVDTVVDEANRLIRKELNLGSKGGGHIEPSGSTPAKKRSRYNEVYIPQQNNLF